MHPSLRSHAGIHLRGSLQVPEAEAPTRIPFQRPAPPPAEEILQYYLRSQQAGFYANGGPCARLLTRRLEAYLGDAAHCIPIANCTVGLMAALRAACDAPAPGRRVILTPSFTFTATACAIEWAGYEPAFVDVETSGWHMDPGALGEALERHAGRVAGVLACATYGVAPPVAQRAAWREACDRHGVALVVDSAPGFGSQDEEGGRLGGLGDLEVFSFHATKPFSVGEGGVIATRDPDQAARIGRLINFGLEPSSRVSTEAGLNAKMSELHAATGLAMLDRYDGVLAGRRALGERLTRAIASYGVIVQQGAGRGTWQCLQVAMPDPASRDRAVAMADERDIEVRSLQRQPLHLHPAFADRTRDELPGTAYLASRCLSLPMANELTDAQIERIVALVRAATA